MPTIYDIAKKSGVSVTTVSRVINNHPHVREETRARVMGILKDMSFVPNTNAGSLVRKSTSSIAVLVPDITNTFFTTLLRGVEDKANESGLSVLLGNTDEEADKEQAYINTFMERRVDGLIIVPADTRKKGFKTIMQHELPLVLVDRSIKGVETDFVGSDNQLGARMMIDYLVKLGHRNFGIISGSRDISVFRERIEGAQSALGQLGIPLDPSFILSGSKPNKDTGYKLTHKLLNLSPRPSAIFAANKSLAVGAVLALHDADLKVPEDVSVVCFDDNDENTFNPFFTSIIQPAYMMGHVAAELLLKRLKSKDAEVSRLQMQPRMVIRHSTASV